jgi:hypothetical protein
VGNTDGTTEEYNIRLNIRHFQNQLAEAEDEEARQFIRRLIEAEEARLAKLVNVSNSGDNADKS